MYGVWVAYRGMRGGFIPMGVRRCLCVSDIRNFCHVGCKNKDFSLHYCRGTTAKRRGSGSSREN